MPEVDETIIREGVEYKYIGYGIWEPVRTQAQIIDESGLPANVFENINTGNNELLVNQQGFESLDNSSTTPLIADAFFLGDSWVDMRDYATATISVSTDVESAEDGLDVQWSVDGITAADHDYYTIDAGASKTFTFGPAQRYCKIQYTNGTSPQGAFILSSVFRKTNVKASSHRISDDIIGQDDSELVTAIIKVQTNDETTYKNVDVQNPLPTDGDSVYGKDLDLIRSSLSAGWTGAVTDLFNDSYSTITNTTSNNPKTIILTFKRPFQTNILGMATSAGDFSNTKIEGSLVGSPTFTIVDESADNTKKTLLVPSISPATLSVLTITFHTADPVTLGTIASSKALQRISRLQALSELSDTVEDISSFRGALKVDTALVHKEGVNLFFFRETGVGSTLAVAASKGDTSITVVDATGFVVGDRLKLTSTIATGQPFLVITVIAVNAITLDRPLVIDLDIGDDADVVTTQLNVVGSLAAPVVFRIMPPNGSLSLIWQLTRLMISITDGAAMDDGKFGGIPALTNGVVLRVVKGNGSIQELTNWKTNGDMALDMYDITYTDKAPAGENGLRGRWTFTKAEFIVELDGTALDQFQLLVQDNLSDLTSSEIKSQGRLFGA